MDLKRLLVVLSLSLGITAIPKTAESYASKTIHPGLVSKLIQFYDQTQGQTLPFNVQEIKTGAINEDSPENDYIRAFNHFQQWQSSKGLYDFPSAGEWAANSALQSGEIPFWALPEESTFDHPINLREHYLALFGCSDVLTGYRDPNCKAYYPYGDHSWAKVQEEFAQGSVGRNFGHIFHLIADVTVPAHVRLDEHWGEVSFLEKLLEDYYSEGAALWPTDVYEVWTDEHYFEIINLLAPKPENVPSFSSLPELFEDLAYFTGSNFYSDGNVDGTVVGLTEVMEGNKKYFVKEIEGKTVHVLKKGMIVNYPDVVCLRDMWKVQGTKSIEYGAAALNLLAEEQLVEPPECTNDCDYEQTSCQNNNVMACTDNDMDDCREWTVALYCGSGQVCKEGDCVPGEPEDCISHDYQDCGSNTTINWFDSCGNIEEVVKNCTGDTYCSNGSCVNEPPTCEDECDNYNQASCSGNNVIKCEYDNNTGCLELMVEESCGGNEKCETGECKPNGSTCQNECDYEGQASKCFDNGFEGEYYVCNFKSDGCLYWTVVYHCGIGKKCIDSKCVLNECSECSTLDEAKCDDTGWNGVLICEPNNNQSCLVWTSWYSCFSDEKCVEGECISGDKLTCQGEYKLCPSGEKCIHESEFCDGKFVDCINGSDEFGCYSCGLTQFSCTDGTCINPVKHCDYTKDCKKGLDEVGCSPCPSTQFRCNNDTCINFLWVCDGDTDCPGGEDEKDC